MNAFGKGGIDIGVERAGSCMGVALDARNLYQTADRVAGHAKMVLQSHFRSILHTGQTSAEAVVRRRGGHGTGHTHFGLAAGFRTGDRSKSLGNVANEPGSGQSMEDTGLTNLAALIYMV